MATILPKLASKIWQIAPAWVNGPISEVEAQAIMRVAMKLNKNLSRRYGELTPGEIVAAACEHYFSR